MHQEKVLFRGPVHQLKLSLAGIGRVKTQVLEINFGPPTVKSKTSKKNSTFATFFSGLQPFGPPKMSLVAEVS